MPPPRRLARRAPLLWMLVLLLAPAPAVAGPRLVTPRALIDLGPREPLSAEDSVLAGIPHPWPGRALLLSMAGCAAPLALALATPGPEDRRERAWIAAAGLTLLPAAGHVYAGQAATAGRWTLVRAIGLASLLATLDPDGRIGESGWVSAFAGAALITGGALLETFNAPGDVARANARLAAARLELACAPGPAGLTVRLALIAPPP